MSSPSSEDAVGSIGIPQLIFCAIVIALVYRFVISSDQAHPIAGSANGERRPRANNAVVSADAIEAIQTMFPQVSIAAIRLDLERNGGSVEATTEKILSEGTLPEPPGIPSRQAAGTPSPQSGSRGQPVRATSSSTGTSAGYTDLITRYNLNSKLGTFLSRPNPSDGDLTLSKKNDKAISTIEGGHKRSIRSLAWKPNTKNESVIATASFDSTTGIWHREEHERAPGNKENSAVLDSEGKEEEEEWRFAVVLDGHDSEVKSVAWSAGGSFLATCSRDKSVWIWEEMEGDNYETIAVLQDHSQDVKMVVWHPEDELLASASYDDTIRLYKEDVDDWVCCAVLTGHTSTVWSISFENAGSASRLASASDDQTARVWKRKSRIAAMKPVVQQPSIIKQAEDETEDWEEECCLPKVHSRTIYSIDWSKNTGLIATAGGDGLIIVYQEIKIDNLQPQFGSSSPEWKIVAQIPAAHGVHEINSVAWCPKWDNEGLKTKEEVLLSAGDDGVVNVFEFETDSS
ncbi:hypothetical protein H072_8856 [Dactylellina haptotyla CBS 200.50]|uniref:Probable cytosolic iron-sulfur protein assembly protein 1 n=1 Tax=Dactylellina haptotyla (strain CBS 200.50) TaxID=1284197 RepID=S8A8J9_DACHA|nr:hypothetical protein H072_8856 [Dactylellina haptotyla CBS 200.50]